MSTVFSLGGVPFQRSGDALHDRTGRFVGRFRGDVVFGPSGDYLGELRGDRLAYNQMHSNQRSSPTVAQVGTVGTASANRVGSVMPAGWEDFRG